MDIAIRFAEALHERSGGSDDPDLLAVRLARAAAVLPVEGVGLSVHGERDLRTPLAASSEVAATAERLQFTAGSGPCLLAAQAGLPVFGTEAVLARRWPVFHDLLVTSTPLRSVLALSLAGRLKGVGGMDLYSADPDGATAVDAFEARCVAELVADHLDGAADWSVWTPTEAPAWVNTPDARRRGRLWMAVGMLTISLQVPAADALALLRGYAYAAGRTADDVAADLVERRLPPDGCARAPAASPDRPAGGARFPGASRPGPGRGRPACGRRRQVAGARCPPGEHLRAHGAAAGTVHVERDAAAPAHGGAPPAARAGLPGEALTRAHDRTPRGRGRPRPGRGAETSGASLRAPVVRRTYPARPCATRQRATGSDPTRPPGSTARPRAHRVPVCPGSGTGSAGLFVPAFTGCFGLTEAADRFSGPCCPRWSSGSSCSARRSAPGCSSGPWGWCPPRGTACRRTDSEGMHPGGPSRRPGAVAGRAARRQSRRRRLSAYIRRSASPISVAAPADASVPPWT
ncbi:hypothetical protein SAMN05660350_00891 [Geodermatophilus obscurus]|uniref:ANTAR domain-containing protein n=1 Tax=Geodermatophilus obscurus TaxID=1861 RepID=A0A1M7SM70_9ACTN|nr:hypothetical protein SAMN05660350_00891 [Geodermatophilus obscurus]